MSETLVYNVTNRVFLRGLDALYRAAVKVHEADALLDCAMELAGALDLEPATGAIEGYYAESPRLALYFGLMRSLQAQPAARRAEVAGSPAFARLARVTGSALYGRPVITDSLFPRPMDSLAAAVLDCAPAWTIPLLVARARERALADDDCSLVGLAARAGDALMLAALAETTVLYRFPPAPGTPAAPEYGWAVIDDVAGAAARFLAEFEAVFGEALPPAVAASAQAYWYAAEDAPVLMRCVRLGYDPKARPVQHYHWGVHPDREGEITVTEFWSPEAWTTQRYAAWLRGSDAPGPHAHPLDDPSPSRLT